MNSFISVKNPIKLSEYVPHSLVMSLKEKFQAFLWIPKSLLPSINIFTYLHKTLSFGAQRGFPLVLEEYREHQIVKLGSFHPCHVSSRSQVDRNKLSEGLLVFAVWGNFLHLLPQVGGLPGESPDRWKSTYSHPQYLEDVQSCRTPLQIFFIFECLSNICLP